MHKFYLLTIVLLSILFSSCDKREESEEGIVSDTLTTQPPAADTAINNTDAVDEQDSIPDLTGTYTGTFDQRPTTLRITEQNEEEFKGAITINYREVINQDVSGKINYEKNTFSMKDLLHSRFRGTYEGTVSEDGRNLSGTFTMDLDNSKFKFNLTKKN